MAVLHRALFTWFVILVFSILLVLRLDLRTQWNWFIVFIPLWIYDTILIVYVIVNIVTFCRNVHDSVWNPLRNKGWYVFGIILKMAAQIMLCLKLQYPAWKFSVYGIMIPLWILFPALIIDVFVTLLRQSRYWYSISFYLILFHWLNAMYLRFGAVPQVINCCEWLSSIS